MKKSIITISICLTFLIVGCFSTSGVISLENKSYFKEIPKIVIKKDRYFLRFRYSETEKFTFFMMTNSKIKDDKLIFYLPVTTSSGNLKGKLQFEEILTQKKIALIKEGLVFWEEPDKQLIPLKIENMEENLDVLEKSSKGANH